MSKLAICVLGEADSGKSTTWYELLGGTVRSSRVNTRSLLIGNRECVDVFLLNSSCEEFDEEIDERLPEESPRILLLAIQYSNDHRIKPADTISWLIDNRFDLYIQWLNPGCDSNGIRPAYDDYLGIVDYINKNKNKNDVVEKWNSSKLHARCKRIKEIINVWARPKKLIYECDD